jgi:ribonuclease P protein component
MKNSLTATEFSAVFEAGHTFFCFPIKLIAVEQPSVLSCSAIKTGFAVPKRVVKKAVCRNRLKRQMRAAFQKHENVLRGTFLAPHTDYKLIFMYCDKKTDISFSVVEDAILANIKALVQGGKP